MSKIFKKIKSAFVIDSEGAGSDAPKQKRSTSAETVKSTQPEASSEPTVTTSEAEYQTVEGQINQKFTDILLKSLEANNQEGFDYIEFKRSIQNLFKMNMDDATVYKSAYATAQTLGATPQGLIASAQRYVTVLDKEEEKFRTALVNQRAKQVDGGLSEIKKYEESIEQKRNQIKKLQDEIDKSEGVLSKMKDEIKVANNKIEKTNRDFVASHSNLVNQIKQDIENINKYLK